MDISILKDCKYAINGGIVVREFEKDELVSNLTDFECNRMIELDMAVEAGASGEEIDAMEVEEVPVEDVEVVEEEPVADYETETVKEAPKKKKTKKKDD